jgi:DivIVA domain-containing protein
VALTPIEVENTQFRVAFRGYAIDEVDAFLDRVQSELARLLSEAQAGGSPAPTPAVSGTEGQEAALRTLLLAQRTADEAVAEARAEAEQIRTAAREEAEATLASARSEAGGARSEAETTLASARFDAAMILASARSEAETTSTAAREEAETTLASAREQAERVLSASRAEAASLDEQIAQRLETALGDLDRRRQRLEASIEELRAFEREYRTRLRAYLEGQLRELSGSGGSDDDGTGVPVGAGRAVVARTASGAVRLDSRADEPPGPVAAPDPAAPTPDR